VQDRRPMVSPASSSDSGFKARFRLALRSPVILALAVLGFFFLVVESFRPFFFLHDDNASQFIGYFVHDFRTLTGTGWLAEIDYYQYGGEPYLEQGQTAVLYPPVYLAVALAGVIPGDVRWTIEWLAVGHLALGLLGFYFWLRSAGVERWPAALGGLAWVLNPFVLIVASSWVNVSFLACCLPWLFWALDRLLVRPSLLSAFWLGTILGLFFLQGTVQWVLYSVFFLGMYAMLRLIVREGMRRGAIAYYLVVSALIFLTLITPLLLPMLHATDASVARAKPLSIEQALSYSIHKTDLVDAQFFRFRPHLVFGITSAILFCPIVCLFPVMALWFFGAGTEVRRRLFPLLFLSLLALFLSSRWHLFLSLAPVFDKFRWPFKVFVFAEFFLLAAFVLSVSSWGRGRARPGGGFNFRASICIAVVLVPGLLVSLTQHEGNYFSNVTLPTTQLPLPPGTDASFGRVITIGQIPYDTASSRFLTYDHATFFGFPSLGGYNPLVGRGQRDFALGLDFPNLFSDPITPEIREKLAARAVRYWIVDPISPQAAEVEALPGFKLLSSERDRLVYEDTQEAPLVYSSTDPATPYPVNYSGNSLLISLRHADASLEISVGPTDGWWYRIDGGPWLRAAYENERLRVDVQASNQRLEISYFDPRFREGLRWSLGFLVLVGVLGGVAKMTRLDVA